MASSTFQQFKFRQTGSSPWSVLWDHLIVGVTSMKTELSQFILLSLLILPGVAAPGLTVLRNPIFTFDSQQALATSYVVPPDPTAAVGPNNYVCAGNRVIT